MFVDAKIQPNFGPTNIPAAKSLTTEQSGFFASRYAAKDIRKTIRTIRTMASASFAAGRVCGCLGVALWARNPSNLFKSIKFILMRIRPIGLIWRIRVSPAGQCADAIVFFCTYCFPFIIELLKYGGIWLGIKNFFTIFAANINH